MNKYLKYIICCLLPLTAVSCFQEDMVEPVGNDDIVLTFDGAAMTKAADTEAEAYVDHVDVLIFNASEVMVHHERVVNSGNSSFTLAAKRSSFTADAGYYVYLVANGSADASVFNGLADVDALREMVQEDSGILYANSGDTPHHFLMDAVAYTGDAEPQTPGTVVLYDGVMSNSTYLKATFRRAAAKVVVTINKGTDISFATGDQTAKAAYYMRNTPVSTTVIDGYPINPTLETPSPAPQNKNFVWGENVITVTAYAYEYDWKDQSIHDKEASLVVNIPVNTTAQGFSENNWYKIPVSQTSSFDRNHIYTVTVTVNALGAISPDNPQELDDLIYNVEEWKQVGVTVGDDANKPAYLQLNTNHVDMYNVNEDNTTLSFSSSSDITSITLDRAYYFNKHGVETQVAAEIRNNISATVESGALNGPVTIFSPVVATTAEERAAMIAALGAAPSRPEELDEPVNPEVPETEEPNPDDFLDNDTWRYSYYYEGEGENVVFYRRNNFTSVVENYTSSQRGYDAAYDAYKAYQNWLANKEQLMEDYENELEEYYSKLAANQAAWDRYNAYNDAVDRINSTASPSHYNTIRYLEFTVTNAQGLTQKFTVEQYPVIYITNSLGWYSYRKDFKGSSSEPTTYQHEGDGIVSVSLTINGNGAYDWKNNYSTNRGSGYWYSKVRTGTNTTGSTRYSSYGWDNGDVEYSNNGSTTNLRMYHVNVTTTSNDYVVGRPKMTYDNALGLTVTDPGEDNQKLVSPSFMIASRLGFFTTNAGNIQNANDAQRLEIFRVHCANYVEVHGSEGNEVVYDNWRLPTEAELKIIMDVQGESGQDAAAVDYLLNAVYYFGASGPVFNTKNDDDIETEGSDTINNDSKSVRCVRDAY